MYPIDSSIAALFDSEQPKVLRITGIAPGRDGSVALYSGSTRVFQQGNGQTLTLLDENGDTVYDSSDASVITLYAEDRPVYAYSPGGVSYQLTITDADVIAGGFNIDRYVINGEKIEFGTAIARELTLALNNDDGKFDLVTFEGTELFVEIGIADWSKPNPTIHYIPCGYFTPDIQPRKLSIIRLKALDRMTRFDVVTPYVATLTDHQGNAITEHEGNVITLKVALPLPCTIAELIAHVCNYCGVPFTQDISGLPNYDAVISSIPELEKSLTFRNIIQWCAGAMGTCAFIDWTGSLRFKWYSGAAYTTTPANRFSSDLHESDITITGVSYSDINDVVHMAGSGDYAIDLTGNYLIDGAPDAIIGAINSAVNGFTYRPFSATVIAAPYLWPLDIITFVDRNGMAHPCAVTNVNYGLNGATALEGVGETTQINKAAAPSAVTNGQAYLIEKNARAVRNLDGSLTQREIFNRLTNNGEAQGMYLENNQLYINAESMQIGRISGKNGLNYWQLDGDDPIFVAQKGMIGNFTLQDGGLKYYETDESNNVFKAEIDTGGISYSLSTTDDSDDKTRIDDAVDIRGNGISFRSQYGNSRPLYADIYATTGEMGTLRGLNFELDTHDVMILFNSGTMSTPNISVRIYEKTFIYANLTVTGNVSAGNGASGTFQSADGKIVTVTNGIVTSITGATPN